MFGIKRPVIGAMPVGELFLFVDTTFGRIGPVSLKEPS
jgi:hypothetical protein